MKNEKKTSQNTRPSLNGPGPSRLTRLKTLCGAGTGRRYKRIGFAVLYYEKSYSMCIKFFGRVLVPGPALTHGHLGQPLRAQATAGPKIASFFLCGLEKSIDHRPS
jgi:hypothetical protein